MSVVEFTWSEFRSLASITVACATDDAMAVLWNVRISVGSDSVTSSCTDRYRIARVIVPRNEGTTADVGKTFIVNGKVLAKFWATIKADAVKYRGNVVLEFTDGEYSGGRVVMRYRNYENGIDMSKFSNYPEIDRMLDEAAVESVSDENDGIPMFAVNPKYLGDIAKLVHPLESGRTPATNVPWEFYVRPNNTPMGRAPKPLYIRRTVDNSSVYRLEYLLQPVAKSV